MLIFLYFPKGESNLLISGLGNYCTAQELRQEINPLLAGVLQRQQSWRVCPKEETHPPRGKGPMLSGASDYGNWASTIHTAQQTEGGDSYQGTYPRRKIQGIADQ